MSLDNSTIAAMTVRESEKQLEQVSSRKAAMRQLRIGFIVSLGALTFGFVPGWIAAVLPKFNTGDSKISVDRKQEINFAMVTEIGHLLIPIPTGILADFGGRRTVFRLAIFLGVIGWSIILFARTLFDLVIGRTVLGFGLSAFVGLTNVYMAEVICKEKRGAFNSMLSVFNNAGVLVMLILANFRIDVTTLVATVITCAEMMLIFYIIESPYYYARKGNAAKGLSSLVWLHGSSNANVIAEFDSIKKHVSTATSPVESLKVIVSNGNHRGLVLAILLNFMTELMGNTTLLLFASGIFADTYGEDGAMSTATFDILLGVGNVLMCLLPTFLSDTVGRKILIVQSVILAGLLNFVGALWYFFKYTSSVHTSDFKWLPIVTTVGAICCGSVYEPVVMMLRGELLSLNGRGMAAGLLSTMKALGNVVCIKLCDLLKTAYGQHACLGMMCVNCFITATVVWLMLPETKNLTLTEIQRKLKNEKSDAESASEYSTAGEL